MIRLLQIEFAKIISYKTFWVVMAVYAAALIAADKLSNFNFNGIQAEPGPAALFWAAGFIAQMFLGYLTIILICNEFENRTLRQHIINGVSRGEVLLGKLLLFFVFILISAFFILLLSFFSGETSAIGGLGSAKLWLILGQFSLRTLAYLSMTLLISLFFKRAGSAIAIFSLWPLMFEPLLGWLLKDYVVGIQEWLPTGVFSNLLKSPFQSMLAPESEITSAIYLATMAYLILFWVISYFKFSRADV